MDEVAWQCSRCHCVDTVGVVHGMTPSAKPSPCTIKHWHWHVMRQHGLVMDCSKPLERRQDEVVCGGGACVVVDLSFPPNPIHLVSRV
jgi:hypothetical protein